MIRYEISGTSMESHTDRSAGGSEASIRVRKEEADIHHSSHLDIRDDRHLLRWDVRRTHLHDNNRDGLSDHLIQGGDQYLECSQQSSKSTIHEDVKLVFPGHDDVLSLWRERDLLFQAYCLD